MLVEGVQIGITNFGEGCADPRFAGVYTRVTRYINWITISYTIWTAYGLCWSLSAKKKPNIDQQCFISFYSFLGVGVQLRMTMAKCKHLGVKVTGHQVKFFSIWCYNKLVEAKKNNVNYCKMCIKRKRSAVLTILVSLPNALGTSKANSFEKEKFPRWYSLYFVG